MPVSTKTPQAVFDTVFAFPPNRETLGGTAYLILETAETSGITSNLLVDCPAFNDANRDFIAEKGGITTLFITHRGGMADVAKFQAAFGAQIVIQEQEAYLLPTVETETFERDRILSPTSRIFWNSGHSPGSACLYHQPYGGILFYRTPPPAQPQWRSSPPQTVQNIPLAAPTAQRCAATHRLHSPKSQLHLSRRQHRLSTRRQKNSSGPTSGLRLQIGRHLQRQKQKCRTKGLSPKKPRNWHRPVADRLAHTSPPQFHPDKLARFFGLAASASAPAAKAD